MTQKFCPQLIGVELGVIPESPTTRCIKLLFRHLLFSIALTGHCGQISFGKLVGSSFVSAARLRMR